jgi:trehalose 6-phosphate phosphatase
VGDCDLMMRHLFTTDGEAALASTMRQHPLLAFDFDGTLAPIVSRPEEARISQTVATRLQTLAQRLPIAIVTGRAVDDVKGRLGFEPHFIVGNHGAEDGQDESSAAARVQKLNALRERLAAHRFELTDAGVRIEDKGQSIALHYRLSLKPSRARALIRELLAPVDASLRVFAGKLVENVISADAPDKAHAVHALVARCGASTAIFAGDDVNDEPVFVAAPPGWLTIRIGRDNAASCARFFLDSPAEVGMLLELMLRLSGDFSSR